MLFYINIYIHTNNSKFPMNLRAVLSKFQFILKKYFYYIFIVSDLIRRFTTLISLYRRPASLHQYIVGR